ncbi:hypothetical protein [Janthinobacterium lividum]|uniref:hypothetical protein n=1 Tax=Janthinobacterium lividum TaxID=29581 RepID=UPI00087409A4|nr:hypothetical protein [Janthinobacterium lividum]
MHKSTTRSLTEHSTIESVKEVVRRFRETGELQIENEVAVLSRLGAFPLNKYLDLIAREEGHGDWMTLSKLLHEQDKGLTDSEDTELYILNASEFNLNVWCRNYEEAKEYLDSHRGFYLLQYKGQCFLAQAPYIIDLGLTPGDPDWEKIGKDWVKPLDPEAKARLRQKLLQAREEARN